MDLPFVLWSQEPQRGFDMAIDRAQSALHIEAFREFNALAPRWNLYRGQLVNIQFAATGDVMRKMVPLAEFLEEVEMTEDRCEAFRHRLERLHMVVTALSIGICVVSGAWFANALFGGADGFGVFSGLLLASAGAWWLGKRLLSDPVKQDAMEAWGCLGDLRARVKRAVALEGPGAIGRERETQLSDPPVAALRLRRRLRAGWPK